MATHLIIDGYNVIRRSPRHADLERVALEAGRRSLLDRLAAYRRATGHRITVVFDGVVGGGAAESRSRDRGIDVVFTPRGTTADETIARMAGDPGRGGVVVVTADLALARAAERRGAAVLSPGRFEARLDLAALGDAHRPPGAAGPPGAWPLDPKDESEEPPRGGRRDKRGNPHRAPKAVRRAAARLRKL